MSGALLTESRRHAAAALVTALLAGASTPASAQAKPVEAGNRPVAGEYRIDSDTTTTSRNAAGAAVERLQHVDGASGRVTVTLRDTFSGSAPAQQNYAGVGPNRWCVPLAGTPPARTAAELCQSVAAGAGGAAQLAACSAARVDDQWRRVDDRTWLRNLRVAGGSPPTGAGTPATGATATAMAPVIEALEEQARTGSPEEAAMARQRLTALRASLGGSGNAAGGVTVVVQERWTRVAETCTPAR